MAVSSTSNFPLVMVNVDASVPVSSRFIDPPATGTVIAPDNETPSAIDTGVVLYTVRAVIVESASTSTQRLSDEVLALSSVIEFRRSLLFALLREIPPLAKLPPPVSVTVVAPKLIAVPEYVRVLSVNTSIVMSPD